MSIWKKVRLSDISTSMYGYTASASTEAVGPKFLRITDIQDRVINWDSVPYCAISEKEYEKYKLYKNDIVVARTGNSTGTNAIIKEDIDAVFASYLIRFRVNEKIADPYFVASVLSSKSFTEFVNQVAGGSAQKGANANILGTFEVSLPPLGVQQRIASIIRLFDDKIELNRRMNETLEQMAMALYKHWFVDFGPFQDEEFVESEIGNIPTCLGLTTIGKAVKVIGGGTPSTKVSEYWENGEINWFTPTDLTSSKTLFITKSTKRITEKGLNESSAKLFPAYSVMMTSRATIGVIAINREPASTNQGFIVLIPNEKFPTFYLYLWLKNNLGSIHSISNGSTFLEVNRSNFKELPIIESDKVLEFNKLVEPIFSQIEALTIESETLTQTRDFLLPRLLSGEIEVREAEEQVEEVLANA